MDAAILLSSYERLKSARGFWDQHWQDIRELVRPAGQEFNKQINPGQRKNEFQYDGTAPDAVEELASGLQSFLMNPTERWFEIKVEGYDEVSDLNAMVWLEEVSDRIYSEYASEDVKLNTSASEVFLDLGSYGTAILSQEWDGGYICFRCYSISDCYLKEGSDGSIDTVHRKIKMTTRQVLQEFEGDKIPAKILESKEPEREWEIIHMVFPRTDRDPSGATAKNMAYASFWVCNDTKDIIRESGYRSFPYHVPRWTRLPNEVYGRSPAMKCLPDIKMLNIMERTMIKAGQKIVDPPLVLPDDGFLLPIKTAPGSLIFKAPGTENPELLPQSTQGLQIGLEHSNQKRDFIRKCFYADWLRLGKDNKEMTAFEASERRDEKLRLMAPMLGRQQSELLGPMIVRSYELLSAAGKFPPPPPSLHRRRLKVCYVSPASRAQLGTKANNMSRFMQDLIPVAQVKPEVMDVIDADGMAQELAIIRGVSRKFLKSPDKIKSERDARAQQQQIQQAAQVAEPASKAMKNIADAQQAAPAGLM